LSVGADGTHASAEAVAAALLALGGQDGGTLVWPDPGSDLHGAIEAQGAEALAWALKNTCQSSWANDPSRSVAAAAWAHALALREPSPAVQALAAWAGGMGALAESRLADAAGHLRASVAAWRALKQPLPAAQASVAMLMPLALQGHFDEALSVGAAAEQVLGRHGDAQGAAKVALNLGSLAMLRDRYSDAGVHYRRAAVLFARLGDRSHSVMADIGQADALSYASRIDEARRLYERAIQRARQHGLPMLAAQADHGRALLALARGRYRDALAGLVRTQKDFAQLGADHYQAEVERDLADAYLELRLLPEAMALYDSLASRLQRQGNTASLPWLLLQRARALDHAGHAPEARAGLAEALALFRTDGNTAGAATAELALLELQLARQDAALAAAPRSDAGPADADGNKDLAAQAEALSRQLPAAAAARARLLQAAAHRQAGQGALALALLQPLCSASDREAHPALYARAWGEAAQVHAASGDRSAASFACETAIQAFEELRAALPGSDFQLAVLAQHLQPFQLRLSLALDHEPPAAVLAWLDRYRARVLSERLGHGRPVQALDPATHERLEPLRQRLNWIRRKDQRLREDGEGGLPQALHDEARQIEQQLLETARRARTLQADPAQNPLGAMGTVSVTALQAHFRGPKALVEYGLMGDELLAVVVAGGRVEVLRRLASWDDVLPRLQRLHFQLDTLRTGSQRLAAHGAQLQSRIQAHLQGLHAQLWAPLQTALAAASDVVVVPCDALHTLPFAALFDGQNWLGERCQLRLAASAALALSAWPGRHGVSEAAAAEASAAASKSDAERQERLHVLVGESRRLPHVRAELDAAAQAMQPASAKWLVDEAARVQATLDQFANAEVLHLACHADFRVDSPAHSALHLSDGVLTAAQIEEQSLTARLVVLSACQTASANAAPGDEGIGLVRAFLMAGAHEVVASLWAVEDEATAQLMRHFYRHWTANGRHAASALQSAQHDLRQTHPHPFHWAAFVLHGATRP